MKRLVRPQPKPLGEKDLTDFVPLQAPVDPLKKRNKREIESMLKKKKKRKVASERSQGGLVLKKTKEGVVELSPEVEEGETRVALGTEEGLAKFPSG